MVQTTEPPPPALTVDDLVRELEHLPSAPRVLPRLKRLLRDGNSSMHEVVELVRLDPGIAARVLQFGNSMYFSRGLRCYTVDEAVNRVGYDQIYELVAAAVASQVLVRPLDTYGLDADELWRRSIACALAAEVLAERTQAERSVAYTIGLLHSIGMVAIDDWALRNRSDLRFVSKDLPLECCESERAALGFHQAETGAALLRLWEFPAVMSEPVRWQYLPGGTAVHFQLSALLHVAKWIRSAVLNPAAPRPPPVTHLLGRMGLTAAQLEGLVKVVATRFRAICAQLEVNEPGTTLRFPGGERTVPR
ncbi:MAG: HDOD domain-containing protein [Verrucomicrobiota bacterium]